MINILAMNTKINKTVTGERDEISFTPLRTRQTIQSTGFEVAQLLSSFEEENYSFYLCNSKLAYLLEKEAKKKQLAYSCFETNIPYMTRNTFVSQNDISIIDEPPIQINDSYIKIFLNSMEGRLKRNDILVFECTQEYISTDSFQFILESLSNKAIQTIIYADTMYLDCLKAHPAKILLVNTRMIEEHALVNNRKYNTYAEYIKLYFSNYAETIVLVVSENRMEAFKGIESIEASYHAFEIEETTQKSYALCALAQSANKELTLEQMLHYTLSMNIVNHISSTLVRPTIQTLSMLENEIKIIKS